MIRVCLVRGKYLNNFEGQNYIFDSKDIRLTGVSSLNPIHSSLPFPIKKFVSISDLPVFRQPVRYIANRLIGDSQNLWGLESLRMDFDIFHTADPHYYYSNQLAKLRKRGLIKKLVSTSWETIAHNNETVVKKKQIKYFSLSQIDHFICHTVKAKKTLIREGIGPEKISVIKLGVNLSRFKNQNHNSKFKNITILFVGRLVEEKGILDLYEAYSKIRGLKIEDRRLNIRLKIIGGGKLQNKINSLIRADLLSNSVLIEKKRYDEMPKVYQEADIFILPSKRTKTWEEQYGMVLVEAMASGLPIIAYDSGAISEVFGDVGLLAREGDKNRLAYLIRQLIEDDGLRLKLGKMGRERAEKYFDARKTSHKIQKVYENISGDFDKK